MHHSFHKNIKQYNCYFKMLQYFTMLLFNCIIAQIDRTRDFFQKH